MCCSFISLTQKLLSQDLLTAFLGTLVPLLVLVFFLLLLSLIDFGSVSTLWQACCSPLSSGPVLRFVVYAFLALASLASRALRDYLNNYRVPDLLTNFRAEAGRVLAHTHSTRSSS